MAHILQQAAKQTLIDFATKRGGNPKQIIEKDGWYRWTDSQGRTFRITAERTET